MVVSSSDSSEYYPENVPTDFRIRLPEILHLKGTWTCSLRDIKCVTTSDVDLYVYSDIVEDSYVHNKKLPLLQYVTGEEGQVTRHFSGPITSRLARPDVGTIHIYIKDSQMKKAPLTEEHTTCTLRFEQLS